MQVNSHNEWDRLNEVVVGKGWMMNLQLLEKSFNIFYRANLGSEIDQLKSHVNKQFLE